LEFIGDIDRQEKTCVELASTVSVLLTQQCVSIRLMIVNNIWRSALRTLGEPPEERADLSSYAEAIRYCNSITTFLRSPAELAALQLLILTTMVIEKGDIDEFTKQGIVLGYAALDAYNAAHGRKFVKEPQGCAETTLYVRALRDRFPHMSGKERYRVAEHEALLGLDSCPFKLVGEHLVSRSSGARMKMKTFQNKN
jgi:hypothetical protein